MKYNYIGKSGLRVSSLCLGTMTFGQMCNKEESFKILDKSVDFGINFLDTAELYPVPPLEEYCGITESIIGEWLQTKPRDSLIIATKVAGAASGWFVPPVRYGLTAIDRFHIERAIEGSLKRLKTDYIDLYQIHWPDTVVPIEESLEAMDRLVRSGKVRYIGISNETSYGLTKSLMVSSFKGYKRFESIQNNFSLLNRRFLDELAQVCKLEQVSLLPYSPLAGGVLSGKYQNGNFPKNARFTEYFKHNGRLKHMAHRFLNEKTLASTARYIEIAKSINISPVTLAIAWCLKFDFIPSVIIGATIASQLEENFKAIDLTLDKDTLKACDKVFEDILYPMG